MHSTFGMRTGPVMNATPRGGNSPHAYIIFLELAPPARPLEKLKTEINAPGHWWHCVAGLWIVTTRHSVEVIHDRLRRHLEVDDRLLVLKINGDCGWYSFEGQGAAWLKDHLLRRGASSRARARHKITGSQPGTGADGSAARVVS